MSISTVAQLNKETGSALVVTQDGSCSAGAFFKDQDGHIQVAIDPIPSGPLYLVLEDGHDSEYPGQFRDGIFSPLEIPALNPKVKSAAIQKLLDGQKAAEATAKALADAVKADPKVQAPPATEEDLAVAKQAEALKKELESLQGELGETQGDEDKEDAAEKNLKDKEDAAGKKSK